MSNWSSSSSGTPVYATPKKPEKKKLNIGGTLHNAKISDWRKASVENRLATSYDFITAVSGDVGWITTDEKHPFAVGLMRCIDEVTKEPLANNKDVTQVASVCLVMLWPDGIKRQ